MPTDDHAAETLQQLASELKAGMGFHFTSSQPSFQDEAVAACHKGAAALLSQGRGIAPETTQDDHAALLPVDASAAVKTEALPDNPPCSRCGGPHPFDTTVPSVVWNATIRRLGLEDYLCLTCIVSAFASQGESFTAELIGGMFQGGLPIEVRVNGAIAKDAAKISDENTVLRARIHELSTQSAWRLRPGKEVPCPACEGEGRMIVGERRVTREMAMDAGEPAMEGSFYGYDYDTCDECGGCGVVSASAEIAYQLGRVKSVEHTPRELAALNAAIAHYEQVGSGNHSLSEASASPGRSESAQDNTIKLESDPSGAEPEPRPIRERIVQAGEVAIALLRATEEPYEDEDLIAAACEALLIAKEWLREAGYFNACVVLDGLQQDLTDGARADEREAYMQHLRESTDALKERLNRSKPTAEHFSQVVSAPAADLPREGGAEEQIDEKDQGASLLPADRPASPTSTEALPSREGVVTILRADYLRLLSAAICENLHHDRSEYHDSGQPCPVEARLKVGRAGT